VTTDDERIAYLAGDHDLPAPDPDPRADLDRLRDVLADEAVWVEPDPGLEDRVVAAIAAEQGALSPEPSQRHLEARRRRTRLIVVAAAAAAILVVAGIAVSRATGSSSPQRFAASLTATDLAPGASGTATLTRTDAGWRMVLHTTGLPRLDNGRYYQAWLKNAAGILVPTGTFNQGPTVALWAGVSPAEFSTVTVTEQLANGNPASSGMRVLVGQVKVAR
jgi:hypothetical protein